MDQSCGRLTRADGLPALTHGESRTSRLPALRSEDRRLTRRLAILVRHPNILTMQMAFHVVFDAARPGPCQERALVLQSRDIPSETVLHEGRYRLLVAEHDVEAALEELAAWRKENIGWRSRREPPRFERMNPWPGILGYVFVILLAGWAAGDNLGNLNWFTSGKVDAGLVRGGDWWRAVTALTLHADLAHLSGNLFFGVVFGYFAGQFFGPGLAWLYILLAGMLGNALNSFLQAASHTSVGASTAIFGALGLVAAFSWKRKLYPQDRWAYRIGPVVGGIALLAYTGTGGERTDVGAHVTGFASGFVLGLAFAVTAWEAHKRATIQWLAGAGAALLLTGSWWLALT